MVAFWLIVGAIALAVAYYAVWGRECMRRRAWSRAILDWIAPVEILLWRKSETLLWARFKMLLALLWAGLAFLGTIDVSPFLVFIPEQHRWWVMGLPPAALALDGVIQEIQRRLTTKPLALVAIEESKLAPDVKAAVDIAEGAKVAAVAAVKASGS